MIDIHTHILPGVDDGPQTMEESIALAKAAEEEGIHTIVATPHHRNGAFDNPGATVTSLVQYINESLKELHINVTVLPGQENRINGDLIEELENGTAISVNNSRYVLVEFSSVHIPNYTKQLFFDLQLHGYTPVIVHPERNQTFLERPDELYHLVKAGAITQITAHCLTGRIDKKTSQFARQLVEHNLTHVISSDAHNVEWRPFDLNEAYQILKNEFGSDVSHTFHTNAKCIVENKNVLIDPPQHIKKKKFLWLF
ncbi:tyrosine-protein phosphatase [Alteribacillus sp. HJP-4]|uniref:tyrosine-protein phosphatase n=1 Tax=Alteribacillus sp. HJP-4 TaxID=2775394 RepID=UPI0035CCF0A0